MGIRPRRLRMSDQSHIPPKHARSSRERYRRFVRDYKARRLDDLTDPNTGQKRLDEPPPAGGEVTASKPGLLGGKRREYLREYLRWLWPHRYAVGVLFLLALIGAGLEMIEPLFMRFIIDRVLLNTELDSAGAPGPPAPGGRACSSA